MKKFRVEKPIPLPKYTALPKIPLAKFGLAVGMAFIDMMEEHSTFFTTIQRTRLHYPIIEYAIVFPTTNWDFDFKPSTGNTSDLISNYFLLKLLPI